MAPRKEQIKEERRRRNSDGLQGRRRRLSVDESTLDRENFEYRWINDEGGRIHALTVQDDWDIVSDRDGTDSTGMGADVSKHVGETEKGDPLRALLVRKHKRHYDEDAAERQRRIDEQEDALKQGAAPQAQQEGQYVPQGGITIGS